MIGSRKYRFTWKRYLGGEKLDVRSTRKKHGQKRGILADGQYETKAAFAPTVPCSGAHVAVVNGDHVCLRDFRCFFAQLFESLILEK